MGEGMIVRRGGSRGAKLRVIAVADVTLLPESAKDGYIGIITDVAAGVVYAQSAQPTEAAEGDVWVRLGVDSTTPIELVKKPPIMIYPIAVYQQIGGSWQDLMSYVRLDGAWKWMGQLLYDCGDEKKAITGGWTHVLNNTGTKYSDFLFLYATSGNRARFVTVNKIDVTNYGRIEIIGRTAPDGMDTPTSSGSVYLGLANTKTQTPGARQAEFSSLILYNNRVLTVNISSYTGKYYIFIDVYNGRRLYCPRVRMLP